MHRETCGGCDRSWPVYVAQNLCTRSVLPFQEQACPAAEELIQETGGRSVRLVEELKSASRSAVALDDTKQRAEPRRAQRAAMLVLEANSRGGTRTPDPVINSHLLYQLSYSGKRNNCNGLPRLTQPLTGARSDRWTCARAWNL